MVAISKDSEMKAKKETKVVKKYPKAQKTHKKSKDEEKDKKSAKSPKIDKKFAKSYDMPGQIYEKPPEVLIYKKSFFC